MSEIPDFTCPPFFSGGIPDIRIAVIDGPANLDHPALTRAKIHTASVPPKHPSGHARDHGTAITALIFGHPTSETPGLAWNCSGILRPIYQDGAEGVIPARQEDLATAIEEVMALGADIINISGAEFRPDAQCSPRLQRTLERAEAAGVLIVAATGNDGGTWANIPALHPSVLAVGAIRRNGTPLASSNWGAYYREHGIVVPGADILTASSDGGVAKRSGTSIATAIVTSLAALLLSAARQAGLAPQGRDLRNALIRGADNPQDLPRLLAGVLNIQNAFLHLILPAGEVPSQTDILPARGPAGEPQICPDKGCLCPAFRPEKHATGK